LDAEKKAKSLSDYRLARYIYKSAIFDYADKGDFNGAFNMLDQARELSPGDTSIPLLQKRLMPFVTDMVIKEAIFKSRVTADHRDMMLVIQDRRYLRTTSAGLCKLLLLDLMAGNIVVRDSAYIRYTGVHRDIPPFKIYTTAKKWFLISDYKYWTLTIGESGKLSIPDSCNYIDIKPTAFEDLNVVADRSGASIKTEDLRSLEFQLLRQGKFLSLTREGYSIRDAGSKAQVIGLPFARSFGYCQLLNRLIVNRRERVEMYDLNSNSCVDSIPGYILYVPPQKIPGLPPPPPDFNDNRLKLELELPGRMIRLESVADFDSSVMLYDLANKKLFPINALTDTAYIRTAHIQYERVQFGDGYIFKQFKPFKDTGHDILNKVKIYHSDLTLSKAFKADAYLYYPEKQALELIHLDGNDIDSIDIYFPKTDTTIELTNARLKITNSIVQALENDTLKIYDLHKSFETPILTIPSPPAGFKQLDQINRRIIAFTPVNNALTLIAAQRSPETRDSGSCFYDLETKKMIFWSNGKPIAIQCADPRHIAFQVNHWLYRIDLTKGEIDSIPFSADLNTEDTHILFANFVVTYTGNHYWDALSYPDIDMILYKNWIKRTIHIHHLYPAREDTLFIPFTFPVVKYFEDQFTDSTLENTINNYVCLTGTPEHVLPDLSGASGLPSLYFVYLDRKLKSAADKRSSLSKVKKGP